MNLGERLAAEARRQAERTGRQVNREIANAFRAGAAEIDLEVLRQIRRINNGSVTVPPEAIESLVDELKTGKTVRLVPALIGDRPIGLKAYAIRPGTFVDAVGTSNRDVITAIDGHPVTSEQTLAKAFDELQPDAEPVRIEVLRGTNRVAIVVQAKEEEPSEPPVPPTPPQKVDFQIVVPDLG